MSTIWPFFNNSFSNANINKILSDIEHDNAQKIKQQSIANNNNNNSSSSTTSNNNNNKLISSIPISLKSIPPSPPSPSLSHSSSPIPISISALSTPTLLLNNDDNNATNSTSPNSNNNNSELNQSITSVSPHVAYSPNANQFNITASQLLHSIQNNSPSPSPLSSNINMKSSHKNDDSDSDNDDDDDNDNQKDDQDYYNDNLNNNNNDTTNTNEPLSGNESITSTLSSDNTQPLFEFSKSNINVHLFNKLLDQPNLLDEINLSKNNKLIDYFSNKDVVDTMLEYLLFSLELSKFTSDSTIPDYFLSHDIFATTDDSTTSNNNSIDDLSENISNNNNNNNNNNTNNNTDNTQVDKNDLTTESKLQTALQRASIISEVMILPSSNIHQTLLSNFDIFTKLWRGFFNSDPKFFFQDIHLIKSNDDLITDSNTNNETTSIDENINISSTDLQKLSELEESNKFENLRDSHELLMFNNFLKFVDDLALINISAFMNFIRFEQDNYLLTNQLIKFIPYSQTVCDLLVRLISTDKSYNSNGLIDILIDQNLILNLLKICEEYYLDHQVQDNICNLLNGIVGISSNIGFWEDNNVNTNANNNSDEQQQEINSNNPNIGPNNLTRQLISADCINEMLNIILNYGNYGLVTIVSVIIEVIRKNNSDYDEFDWISSITDIPNINENEININDTNKDKDNDINNNNDNDNNETNNEKQKEDEDENENETQKDSNKLEDDKERDNSIPSKNMPSSRDPIYLGNLLKLFSLNLDKITETYLTNKFYERKCNLNSTKKLKSSIGETIEPLGYERFKIMELIAELLHCSNMILMNKSIKLDELICQRDSLRDTKNTEQLMNDAINALIINENSNPNNDQNNELKLNNSKYIKLPLDLSIGNFFKYQLLKTNAIPLITLKLVKFPWNNFMHNVIFDLIQQIFNGRLANWDEDRAINQEETIFDDNLSLNKILIWSLFGEFDNFETIDEIDYKCNNLNYPGYFNLSLFIIYCYKLSNEMYERTNFRYGYMGHLTLIAEEIHKFQSYVENFGATKNENAFGLHKEIEDNIRPFYLKSSYFIFNELYECIFENKGNFQPWLNFVNNELREISSMYNKVLGNPNEIEDTNVENDVTENENENEGEVLENNDENNLHLGLSSKEVMENIKLDEPPKASNAIILDNGDSEEFRRGDSNE